VAMIYVKQWGMKRSGTNYLRWILEQNVPEVSVVADIGGWKHSLPSVEWTPERDAWWPEGRPKRQKTKAEIAGIFNAWVHGEIRHAVCVKSPLSWIASIARRDGFSPRRMTPSTALRYARRWSAGALAYRKFVERVDMAALVRYEDVYPLERGSLTALCDLLALRAPNAKLKAPTMRLKNTSDLESGKSALTAERFRTGYYENALFEDELAHVRDVIEGAIDAETMVRFGYGTIDLMKAQMERDMGLAT